MLDRLRRLVGLAPMPPAPAPVTAPAVAVPAYGAWTPDAAWMARRRSIAATYSDLDDSSVKQLVNTMPAASAATVAAAERAIRHEFDLLGSGTFVPVDPDRPARGGYQPIDWYLDPVRQLRFPRGVHHKAWNLYEMRPANADVKYPWELGALPALGGRSARPFASRETSALPARLPRSWTTSSRPIQWVSASTGPARWTSACARSAGSSPWI